MIFTSEQELPHIVERIPHRCAIPIENGRNLLPIRKHIVRAKVTMDQLPRLGQAATRCAIF